MDNDFVFDDKNDVQKDDVEDSQSRVVKRCRHQFSTKELQILENAFKETGHIDTEKAVKLSTFVGLPYYKIRKWFSNRRAKERRVMENENKPNVSNVMEVYDTKEDARIMTGLPAKRPRNDTDLPTTRSFQTLSYLQMIPVSLQKQSAEKQTKQDHHALPYHQQTLQELKQTTFDPKSNQGHWQTICHSKSSQGHKQTTLHPKPNLMQGIHQIPFGVKQQTITQQIHSQPLCWPPMYQANPSFNLPNAPSMSRVLVDYLKENPHLLTPVQPAKRRRVESDDGVPKCEDSILEKVKRWFSTMETPEPDTSADDDLLPETETSDCSKRAILNEPSSPRRLSSAQKIRSSVQSSEDKSDKSEELSQKGNDIVPDDVSVMLNSYTESTREGFSDSALSEARSQTSDPGNLRVGDTDSNPDTDLSDSSDRLECPRIVGHWKGSSGDVTIKCFERKSFGQTEDKLVNMP